MSLHNSINKFTIGLIFRGKLVLLTLIFILFSIQEQCFTQLRTFKGLGYIVHCFSNKMKDSGDFSVVVESAKFHPNYVIDSIHDFLINMYHQISKIITPSFFETTVQSFSLTIMQAVQKGKTSKEFWEGVTIKDFQSAALHDLDLVEEAQKMNFDDYKELFYKYFINESTRRMLTIVANGKGRATKLNVDCNISLDKIDQTKLDLYHACI